MTEELDARERLTRRIAVGLLPVVAEQLRGIGIGLERTHLRQWARALAEKVVQLLGEIGVECEKALQAGDWKKQ